MRYCITGGTGFIGSNYAARLLERGEQVVVFDNLSRRGVGRNLAWLQSRFGEGAFTFIHGDVRDAASVASGACQADVIVHLASQVAVTTSVQDPRTDFECNALGTFNVLEAARLSGRRPIVLYASTNKVYGGMQRLRVAELESRYACGDYPLGIPESFPLDFHSPYGCSKGAGDQYVRDYALMYGLPTVVFRQSCIYGPRQFGAEDQGWVAWFIIAAQTGLPITIYGNGKQVRDLLFVEDLLDAYDAAVTRIDGAAGEIYNLGGGPAQQLSVWSEFRPLLEGLLGRSVPVTWKDCRPGDQRFYVSDIRKAARELAWRPRVGVQEGLRRLYDWVEAQRSVLEQL